MILIRLFVIIGGLIVLALSVALVGPYFVDWTPYRADFEREASRILGREVRVGGTASARLLPFPSVTFSDVEVAGGPDGAPAMTAATFSMDAELAPFLSGEVLIFDMRLDRPRATVTVGADGAIDWTVRPNAPVGADRITLEKLTITDGEAVILHGPSGRRHVISDIDADVSARTLGGPWRFDGSLAFDGVRGQVLISTGTVSADGDMRLRVVARPDGLPLTVETDGPATVRDGRGRYEGQFRVATTVADKGEAKPAAAGAADPGRGYRVTGRFTLDHERLSADEYRFETGPVEEPYTAEGVAWLAFGDEPEFRIEANGAQVRFDQTPPSAEPAGLTLERRVAAVKAFFDMAPKPAIKGVVAVKLPAVVAGDTTIRDVALTAGPAEEGWAIRSLAAQLPGRTTLEASGLLKTGDAFGFSGSLLLAVGQPSGFAAWLSKDVDEAIRLLPAAGFLAAVDLNERRQIFSDLELILGESRFRGRVESRQPDDARPTALVELDGGALDLDGLAAFASLFFSDAGENRFADRDIDIAIKAGPVAARGLRAGSLDMAVRMREREVEIDRLLVGDFAGASVSATGTLRDLATEPAGKIDASIVAVDLAEFVDAIAERFPDNAAAKGLKARTDAYPGLFEDAQIDLMAASGEKAAGQATVTASGQAGGMNFTFNGAGPADPARLAGEPISLALSAKSDDLAPLLALYGVRAFPLGIAGKADTILTARGTLGDGLRTRLILTGETADAAFEGSISATAGGLAASGALSIEGADIEPWMVTTGLSLPGMGLGLPVSLKAKADLGDGLLALSGIAGKVADLAVSGDLDASLKAGTPDIVGRLDIDAFDLALPVAGVLGDGILGEGARPDDEDAAFASDTPPPLTANIDLTTRSLLLGPSIDLADARLSLQLDRDSLRVAELDAGYGEGRLSGLFELRNTDGTGLFSGQFGLKDADIAALAAGLPLSGRTDLTASLTANGKSIGGMASSLGGSGTAALRDLVIDGINPGGFAPLLAAADAAGRDINAEAVAAFAPAIAAGGRLAAGNADLAFTLANGVLRAPPVHFATDKATMTVELRADIAARTAGVTGEVVYDAGDEAIAGAAPAIDFSAGGPFDAMTGQMDTARLAQFLTQRALEREQARVEAMQAALLEKQRLRREVAYYRDRAETRTRIAEEQARLEREERIRAEERARLAAEEEARREAERRRQAVEPPAPERPATPDSGSIERRALPPPTDGTEPVQSGQAPIPADPSSIFRVFGKDGRSIDAVLREANPLQ